MKEFWPSAESRKYRRHLPHWRREGATYFVTFRLWDSIPKEVWERFCQERLRWLQHRLSASSDHSVEGAEQRSVSRLTRNNWKEVLSKLPQKDSEEYYRRFHKRMDTLLDSGSGACWLGRPRTALVVSETLRFFDGQRYILGDYVIMPNHVHVLVTPVNETALEKITHSWKSYSAKEINKAIERRGQVWQHESFDHIVRNEYRLDRFCQYIAENPKRANLNPGEFVLYQNST